jgi:hypothetical protein
MLSGAKHPRSSSNALEVEQQLQRCFAEFTLSELRGFFASLGMTSEGLSMTNLSQ